MNCPCGSHTEFSQCCEPIINQKSTATSTEQLMRSRYSAYVIKDYDYIYNTYANDKKNSELKKEIRDWGNEVTWLKLNILPLTSPQIRPNNVIFSAYYLHGNTFNKMTEESIFSFENGQWHYLCPHEIKHEVLPYPKRNSTCPCNSLKKFKKCCGS